ncbi:unnamed protein product [Clonostachys rosea]|uniref:Peptidase S8/S53 domain-containing protein n=1 Tax=Bionectria ochroleuca TaxID=29856 RepID=A0ABY6ULI1_BIOOC|nr:unnamed protein product [Clonostachys rosea]
MYRQNFDPQPQGFNYRRFHILRDIHRSYRRLNQGAASCNERETLFHHTPREDPSSSSNTRYCTSSQLPEIGLGNQRPPQQTSMNVWSANRLGHLLSEFRFMKHGLIEQKTSRNSRHWEDSTAAGLTGRPLDIPESPCPPDARDGFCDPRGAAQAISTGSSPGFSDGLVKPGSKGWLGIYSLHVIELRSKIQEEDINIENAKQGNVNAKGKDVIVALLDSGFWESSSCKPGSVKAWKDFVEEPPVAVDKSGKITTKDVYGHGALMGGLIVQLAPGVKLCVARVAKDSSDMKRRAGEIAQAIRWAGEQGADIICMAWGFPKDQECIRKAIRELEMKRNGKVIFLSACGNTPGALQQFPARDKSVMSIFATDDRGMPCASNPRTYPDTKVIGTFGEEVPANLLGGFAEEFKDLSRKGSSVATAVATAIAVQLITFGDRWLRKNPGDLVFQRKIALIREQAGMEAVLHAMAARCDNLGFGHMRFVDPVSFWHSFDGDEAEMAGYLSSSLSDLYRTKEYA